jgi:hypothetical protein
MTTTRLPLRQRLGGVLGLVAPHHHGEERRLPLPPSGDGHPQRRPGDPALGVPPATVQKAYQLLGKVLGAAVDAGMLAQSPCRRVPLPKMERRRCGS